MINDNPPMASGHKLSRTERSRRAEQIQRNEALIQLLKSWREGDEEEQHDTLEYLKQALDEDRLSNRKLFP